MSYLRSYGTRRTPQNQPIPGSNQVQNDAGGYVWQVDDWKSLDRFLILGTSGGSFYVKQKELTTKNADAVLRCIKQDAVRVVKRIVEVSEAGRAPKNDPAIFALAMVAGLGDEIGRKAALEAIPKVCRIGTHLLHFAAYVEQFRGWGRGLRKAIGDWFNNQTPENLSYQMIKYQSRDKWSNRDLLRLAHPKPASEKHKELYHWVTQGWESVDIEILPHTDEALKLIWAFERAKKAENVKEIIALISGCKLPREAVPTKWLNDPDVWSVLLQDMPITALIRNLATMTRVGLLKPMCSATTYVLNVLRDGERLRKARVHPIMVLSALKTYAQGHGERSQNTWTPVTSIIDALDAAFYASFGNVVPCNKPLVLALDVSGSMGSGVIAGIPGLTPREASAAIALVTAATEPHYTIVGFGHNMVNLSISPRQRLDDAVRAISGLPFGGTDCALPMLWALQNNLSADGFVIFTDDETWYGRIHPAQALQQYRATLNSRAKLVVCAMVANEFSIADPNDAGMLDVVGCDTATPQVISDFIGED